MATPFQNEQDALMEASIDIAERCNEAEAEGCTSDEARQLFERLLQKHEATLPGIRKYMRVNAQ